MQVMTKSHLNHRYHNLLNVFPFIDSEQKIISRQNTILEGRESLNFELRALLIL